MWASLRLVNSVELEPHETHRTGRIVAAVERCQRVGYEVQGEERADAQCEMLADRKIADSAGGNLAHAIGGPLLDVRQLSILGWLSAPEQRPSRMPDRRFSGQRIVIVAPAGLAAPGQRSGQLPPRRNFIRPERARRPALLVDARLELL